MIAVVVVIHPQGTIEVLHIRKRIVFHRAVHKQGLILGICNNGCHHQTQFVDDPSPLESAVENTAALQQELLDAEVGLQLEQCFFDVDFGAFINNVNLTSTRTCLNKGN